MSRETKPNIFYDEGLSEGQQGRLAALFFKLDAAPNAGKAALGMFDTARGVVERGSAIGAQRIEQRSQADVIVLAAAQVFGDPAQIDTLVAFDNATNLAIRTALERMPSSLRDDQDARRLNRIATYTGQLIEYYNSQTLQSGALGAAS